MLCFIRTEERSTKRPLFVVMPARALIANCLSSVNAPIMPAIAERREV